MPLSVSCPCGAKLNVPDSAAGKRVKCPRCGESLAVPTAAEFEVVEEEPAAPSRSRRRVEEDEDDRPARSSRRRDDDEEEDEEDDRPRKSKGKKKAKKSAGVPVWVWAAGGGGVLIVGVVVAVLALGGKGGGGGDSGGGGGLFGKSAPPGYTDVSDRDGGFRVFLPGQIKKAEVKGNVPPGFVAWGGSDGNTTVFIRSYPPVANSTFGNQPDQLYGSLKTHGGGIEAPWNDILSKTPVTLGGKPGLEVRIQYKKGWMERPEIPDNDPPLPPNASPEVRKEWEEIRKQREENRKRQKESQEKSEAAHDRREVYFVATDGKRLIVVHLDSKGQFPGDETLKTIRESFEFL
jgi:hypothetical protein